MVQGPLMAEATGFGPARLGRLRTLGAFRIRSPAHSTTLPHLLKRPPYGAAVSVSGTSSFFTRSARATFWPSRARIPSLAILLTSG